MTPKEKAEELVYSFRKHVKDWDYWMDEPLDIDHAKQCALIAVDEIIGSKPHNYKYLDKWFNDSDELSRQNIDYWQEVKTEIEK